MKPPLSRPLISFHPSTLLERPSTVAFQASVTGVPALTARFKRARRGAAGVLGDLIAYLSLSIDDAKRLLGATGQ